MGSACVPSAISSTRSGARKCVAQGGRGWRVGSRSLPRRFFRSCVSRVPHDADRKNESGSLPAARS